MGGREPEGQQSCRWMKPGVRRAPVWAERTWHCVSLSPIKSCGDLARASPLSLLSAHMRARGGSGTISHTAWTDPRGWAVG